MSLELDDLVKKSVELREAGRLDEAIITARRATSIDPESANARWQLALAIAEKDGEAAAIEHLKKTVELAEHFGYGWHRLGNAYKKVAMMDEAVAAWEMACLYDEDNEWTRYNLVDAYNSRDLQSESASLFNQLIELEKQDKLRTNDFHLLAMAHHKKGDTQNSVPYYKRYLSEIDDVYGYTNLSFAFASSQLMQELNAADSCQMALRLDPDFERASTHHNKLRIRLSEISNNVRRGGLVKNLNPVESWYEKYINPFELLRIRPEDGEDDIEIKAIQKAKKILLQEIELEDGRVEWVDNLKIDKSRAIRLADELTNEDLYRYHLIVYRYKPLLNFLSRGDASLFLYDEGNVPVELITTLEVDDKFARWLSEPFSEQYDSIFHAALTSKDIEILKALLSGRRYVIHEHEDKCFATGTRYLSNLIENFKNDQKRSGNSRPTIEAIESALDKDNFIEILVILPSAFQKLQIEVAEAIRSISVDANNKYGDPSLALRIIYLVSGIALKIPSFKTRMDEDIAKLNELIKEEKKDEVHLTFGKAESAHFSITKDGIKHGDKFLSVNSIISARWGIKVTTEAGRRKHEFIMVFVGWASQSDQSYISWLDTKDRVAGSKVSLRSAPKIVIDKSWISIDNADAQKEIFNDCVKAIFSYILQPIIEKLKSDLDARRTVSVGDVPVTANGVQLKIPGWFGTKEQFFRWESLDSNVVNGDAVITSSDNSKAKISLPLADIDNAWVLHIIIKQGVMK